MYVSKTPALFTAGPASLVSVLAWRVVGGPALQMLVGAWINGWQLFGSPLHDPPRSGAVLPNLPRIIGFLCPWREPLNCQRKEGCALKLTGCAP